MSKQRILQLLKEQQGAPLSGEDIAGNLGISRAAVWKAIKGLRELGYHISAKTNQGYQLVGGSSFSKEEILSCMDTQILGREVVFLDAVDSTNNYGRELAQGGAKEGTCIVARQQSGGKGRMERSFYSPKEDGLYFSLILRPKLHFADINLLTLCVALSVTDGIMNLTQKRPKIKWPNDILFHDQKVCGILSECMLQAETGDLDYLVCGIGINVNHLAFPDDMEKIATSLYLETNREWNKAVLLADICKNLEGWYGDHQLLKTPEEIKNSYLKDVIMIGQQVTFIKNGEQKIATATNIDNHGGLIVTYPNGSAEILYAGEINLRRIV